MLLKNKNFLISIIAILILSIISIAVYVDSKTLGEYEIGVFGISLGADYELQSNIATGNNICGNSISIIKSKICSYTVLPLDSDGEVVGVPYLYWDIYDPSPLLKFFGSEEKQKVVSKLEIVMFDHKSYPIIGDTVRSAVSLNQMERIKEAYIQKYGTPIESGSFFNWTLDNGVQVSLEIEKNDYTLYEKWNPFLSSFRDSYLVIGRYTLPKSKWELLLPGATQTSKI
ncbi:MAG: hypothetical protein RLZZ71_2133 [Bacteroidota bacterium]|jgi:hypothetical protein